MYTNEVLCAWGGGSPAKVIC